MADFFDLFDHSSAALERLTLKKGDVLFRQDEPGNSMYIVESGRLQAFLKDEAEMEVPVGYINTGDPVGEMQLLTGGKRTATVVADEPAVLIELPADILGLLKAENSETYQKLTNLIVQRLHRNHLLILLPELFGKLDENALEALEQNLEWIQLQRGERLIQQGDMGDAMYIVVSGRLQVQLAGLDGLESPILQISRGETVGEMALFTDDSRTASVDALRDSLLVRLSKKSFLEHIAANPKLHEHVTQVVMRRLQHTANPVKGAAVYPNVVIIPLSESINITGFIEKLKGELLPWENVLHVSKSQLARATALQTDDAALADHANLLRLTTWLDAQEQQDALILLEAEVRPSIWTSTVIQYADRVIFVGEAGPDVSLREVETRYQENFGALQTILLLIHAADTQLPSGTAGWLAPRKVDGHFHLRKGNTADFQRIARFLAGKSIGLVLGGGGARGFAHIGIIQAFREQGIPVDMVGGTSMGAVLAAHAAMELDMQDMLQRNRKAFVEEKPFRKQLLPVFSFYKGKKLDEVTRQILYQDTCIEDLWLPCFIVSCSLGTAELVVHESGKVWEAVRASTALPGIVTPVSDGNLLHVDGGLMNNLPVDLMRSRCPGKIVAVDVSDMTDLDTRELAPPSVLTYFRNRWFRKTSKNKFPHVLEVLMRSLLLGSVQNVKRVREEADLIMKPPVDRFSLLEFEMIEEVMEVGYQYALEVLESFKEACGLKTMP